MTLIISTVFVKSLRNAPLNFTAFSLQAVSYHVFRAQSGSSKVMVMHNERIARIARVHEQVTKELKEKDGNSES